MHAGLARSIEHICERSRGVIEIDEAAISRLCARLEAGARFPPSTFGLYYDLVPALEAGDHEGARRLLSELAGERPAEPGTSVHALGDGPRARHADRYRRMMDTDPSSPVELATPSPARCAELEAGLRDAFDRLDRWIPELADEIRAIISELVMVADADGGERFEGGSSYMLWGALFLNAGVDRTEIELIEVLAHESAHSLLFGFCTDEPLVLNGDEERYPSPLREDPRPLDGIFHATFVSARMHWVLDRLLELGALDEEAAAAALEARARDRASFEDGYGVVARHGRLTATGRSVMAGARSYIDSCSS